MPKGIYKRTEEYKRKLSESKKAEKHPNWKGGIAKYGGRIYIYNPIHPYAKKDNYILQSRLIMEKILGRYLLPEEVIHHKNKKKDDDRPENLMLFENVGKHTSFHFRRKNERNVFNQKGIGKDSFGL